MNSSRLGASLSAAGLRLFNSCQLIYLPDVTYLFPFPRTRNTVGNSTRGGGSEEMRAPAECSSVPAVDKSVVGNVSQNRLGWMPKLPTFRFQRTFGLVPDVF